MRLTRAILLAALLGGVISICGAAPYPSKAIRIVVPFTPGGTADLMARTIGAELAKSLGQSVVAENRPGAGGNIGADIVAKAAPDGHTLLLATVSTHGINPSLYPRMPYDAVKDFAPVSLISKVSNVLVVHPSFAAKSVRDVIALAKAKPGELTFASSGNGTSLHLSGELFKMMANVELTHIPYKGSAPAIADLLGGHVSIMFDNLPSALPHINGGKLRALAVTTAKRQPALPRLPTMAESGLPGYEASSWFGVMAPANTAPAIIDQLNREVVKILRQPRIQTLLASQGAQAAPCTPAQFSAHVKAELAKWAKIVKASGARVD